MAQHMRGGQKAIWLVLSFHCGSLRIELRSLGLVGSPYFPQLYPLASPILCHPDCKYQNLSSRSIKASIYLPEASAGHNNQTRRRVLASLEPKTQTLAITSSPVHLCLSLAGSLHLMETLLIGASPQDRM